VSAAYEILVVRVELSLYEERPHPVAVGLYRQKGVHSASVELCAEREHLGRECRIGRLSDAADRLNQIENVAGEAFLSRVAPRQPVVQQQRY